MDEFLHAVEDDEHALISADGLFGNTDSSEQMLLL